MRNSMPLLRIVSVSCLTSFIVLVSACSDDETTSPTSTSPDASPPIVTGDAGPSVTCSSAGVALCGGACVSTLTDAKHCGGCDKACGANEGCANGACVAQCAVDGKTYASGAVNSINSCEACTPATSATAWTKLADGAPCNPGQVCKTGVCAPGCFIGGTFHAAGAPNPTNACEVCTPATSTTAFTARATVPLLAATDLVTSQGWTIDQGGAATVTYGADYVRIATTADGYAILKYANAVDPTKAWKLRATVQVESVTTHNQYDAAAALMFAGYGAQFGQSADRAQMVYLDGAGVGWADDSQSAAVTVTDGNYHLYELAVDAAKVATFSVDGVQKLTRNNFAATGTIGIGDQTNDANVAGVMRIKSIERVCP